MVGTERALVRRVAGLTTLLGGGWLLRALRGTPAAVGAGVRAIRPVAQGSPNYRGGAFVNVDPASLMSFDREQQWVLAREFFGSRAAGRPATRIPLITPGSADLGAGAADLAACWYGHSTAMVEIDGYRVLTDPIWSRRCSPSQVVGPQRLHEMPAPLEALPAIDAVLISHDHYDHLDMGTIVRLARTQRAPFVVPLGVGAHLRKWRIPEARIIELDWYESRRIGELTLTCTPARHFSGRMFTRNTTLWASWVITGPRHRAFFGGDTGYTKSFTEIGADHGPFDLTLMPIGAYHSSWPDIHMNPEEAVRAHLDLAEADSGLLVPVHWATFRLAPHPWAEPVERLLAAADQAGVQVVVPKPGQRVDRDSVGAVEQWWRP